MTAWCVLRCLLQILQIEDSSTFLVAPETFNLRVEELSIIDLTFLAPSSNHSAAAGSSAAAAAAAAKPVLALLYEDSKQARHVKTYTLNLQSKVGDRLDRVGLFCHTLTRSCGDAGSCATVGLAHDMKQSVEERGRFGAALHGYTTSTEGSLLSNSIASMTRRHKASADLVG